MIQATTLQDFAAYLSIADNRITDSKASQTSYLFKLTNDMTGDIHYCYPEPAFYSTRYSNFKFKYNVVPDMYSGEVNLIPAGYWKYAVYEVTWIGDRGVAVGTAPATENDVLPVNDDNGVVKGLITKGKMYVKEKSGTEQVQYTQRITEDETNYVYYGQ